MCVASKCRSHTWCMHNPGIREIDCGQFCVTSCNMFIMHVHSVVTQADGQTYNRKVYCVASSLFQLAATTRTGMQGHNHHSLNTTGLCLNSFAGSLWATFLSVLSTASRQNGNGYCAYDTVRCTGFLASGHPHLTIGSAESLKGSAGITSWTCCYILCYMHQ